MLMSLEFSATRQTIVKKGLGEALLQVKEGVAGGRHAVHTLFDLALKQDPEVFRVLQAFADDADARTSRSDAA